MIKPQFLIEHDAFYFLKYELVDHWRLNVQIAVPKERQYREDIRERLMEIRDKFKMRHLAHSFNSQSFENTKLRCIAIPDNGAYLFYPQVIFETITFNVKDKGRCFQLDFRYTETPIRLGGDNLEDMRIAANLVAALNQNKQDYLEEMDCANCVYGNPHSKENCAKYARR